MYCPECRVEYRDGFTQCADCHVPLVANKPPDLLEHDFDLEDPEIGNPSLELRSVLEGNDRLLLASARGLLEDAGIPFHALGDEIRPDMSLGRSCSCSNRMTFETNTLLPHL